jgi:hypothetical protein
VNWKASLLGAVVVVAAGAATGAAIGGKTTTRTRTATVTQTVKVSTPATAPSATTTEAAGSTSTTEPATTSAEVTTGAAAPTANSNEEYLADYLETQGGAEALNRNATNAGMDTEAAQKELAGQTYTHAVAFDLSGQGGDYPALTASYQLPTPGFTRLASSAIGLQTSSNASTVFHLAVYKNEDSSPHSVILYQADFRGPSTVHKMSFAIQGATDILFVWTHKTSEPEEGSTFILADPVLTR